MPRVMNPVDKTPFLTDAEIEKLVRLHLTPGKDGLISLYSLEAANDLMGQIGKNWRDFGLDDGSDAPAYVHLCSVAWREMAGRIVMNGRRYGFDTAASLAKIEEAMLYGAPLTYAELGTTCEELESWVKKTKGPS